MKRHFVFSLLWALTAVTSASPVLSLPPAVDNSALAAFPPIINQKGGSCAQASGIGYMFTYEVNRLLKRNASDGDANTFAYLFTWNFVNGGADNGGFVDEGLSIARNYGVMTNADYGYASAVQFKWVSGFEKYLNATRYRVRRVNTFNCTTEADIQKIKQYLYNKGDGTAMGGVLTFSTRSVGWTFDNNYQGPSATGYHCLLKNLATSGAHAMTIAGYDDKVEYRDENGILRKGAFIVVNSWGRFWGDRGRFYMPYRFFTHRQSASELVLGSTMMGCDVYINQPSIVYKVRLNYSSRDDLSLTYGASDNAYAQSMLQRYNSVIFYNQGGDHAMRGSYTSDKAGELEFALDCSELLPSPSHNFKKYFLNVIRSQHGQKYGEGVIEYLSVLDYRGNTGHPKEYVCRNIAGTPLALGRNLFGVQMRHEGHFSANKLSYVKADGSIDTRTFVVRTASGHYAKLRFSGTPEASKFTYTILK